MLKLAFMSSKQSIVAFVIFVHLFGARGFNIQSLLHRKLNKTGDEYLASF